MKEHVSPIDRQSELLLKIKEQGTASISELALHFDVSEMTIRRMIHRLVDAGLVIRTPGGAMPAPAGSMERTFVERSAKMAAAKEALGRAAAGLVAEGETVVLDSGDDAVHRSVHGRTPQSGGNYSFACGIG